MVSASEDGDVRSRRTARRVFWIFGMFAALYLAVVGYAAIEFAGRQPSRDPFNGFALATLTLPTSIVAMETMRSVAANDRATYFLLASGFCALVNVAGAYLLTDLLVTLSLRD